VAAMGRLVDIDELADAASVARLLGLSHRNSVAIYRRRYADFPEPVWSSEGGKCVLWLRSEVEAWARATGRIP
jgi:hypothetical protein